MAISKNLNMTGWCMTMKQRKWSVFEQAVFLRKIAELLSRGYPLSEAIESLAYQLPPFRKEELMNCLVYLNKGLPLHHVLSQIGFNKDLTGYVYFAEQHGSFADALLEGSSLAIKREKDRQKLLKLLNYPLLLIFLTGGMFYFVQKTLLPRFTSLFKTMNLQANFFTKVVYAFGKYFPFAIELLLVLLIIASIYYFYIFRKKSLLTQRKYLIRIPLAGRILALLYTQYFSVQLSFLLGGGLSITESLLLFEKNRSQPFYSDLGKEIKTRLLTGENLEEIIRGFPFFEKDFSKIVKHGQENGKLEKELLFYSQHCVASLEDKIEKYLRTIQPVLFLFIGFLVVSMYLSILLPMFHLMDGV